MLADLPTVSCSFGGGVEEVEPDIHARYGVLVSRLGEARVGSQHWLLVVACAAGWQRYATVLEVDLIGANQLLEHLSPHPTFGVTWNGVQDASPLARMAVTGRQNW